MNTELLKAGWSFYALQILIVSLLLLIAVVVFSRWRKWSKIKRWSEVGIAVCLLVSIVPMIDLFHRDWSIPECRNANGTLKKENPKCQFP